MNRVKDESRTEVILRATEELLFEVGFDNFGVREVADKASVGLGTIYRRWPTKEALIADALNTSRSQPLPEAQTEREAIIQFVQHRAEYFVPHTQAFPSLIAASRSDEALAQAVRDNVKRNIDTPLRALIGDYIGNDHPGLDVLSQLPAALLIHRLVLLSGSVEPTAFAEEILTAIDAVKTELA